MKNEKGMISIEALICLTLMTAFFAIIFNFLDLIVIQAKVQFAADEVAKRMAYYSAACGDYDNCDELLLIMDEVAMYNSYKEFETDEEAALRAAISKNYASGDAKKAFDSILTNGYENTTLDNYLKKHGVKNGIAGISLSGSGIDSAGNIHIIATYEIGAINVPFINLTMLNRKVAVCASTKSWGE